MSAPAREGRRVNEASCLIEKRGHPPHIFIEGDENTHRACPPNRKTQRMKMTCAEALVTSGPAVTRNSRR